MKKLLLFTLILFSQLASASVKWVTDQEISKIHAVGSGNFIIYLTNSADTICQGNGKLFYVYQDIDSNNPIGNGINSEGLKSLLSMTMMAFASEKTVDLKYDNSSSACMVQEVIVNK